MGRLAEMWKSAAAGPATPLPTPGALLTLDVASQPASLPEPTEDDDVPFIEVGGPKPVMRNLETAPTRPAAAPKQSPIRKPNSDVPADPAPAAPAVTPAEKALSVRFDSLANGGDGSLGIAADIIAFHNPNHAISQQYRSLAAEIARQLPGDNPRAVLIVAAERGAGATAVAINLGVTLAKQDERRIAILDADGENPELAARLGISPSPGLSDVLLRRQPATWSLRETAQSRLFALPAERGAPTTDAALVSVIEQIRARCDWLIVDAGVWRPRLAVVAAACDAAYLVHAEGDAAVRSLIPAILAATGRLRGCIVTKR
jgi:Mrp family chromosome partitioning ATPase